MSEVVTVGCKLGNGLILRTFAPQKMSVPVIGGGMKDVTEFKPDGRMYTINGNRAPHATPLVDAQGNAIMLEQSFALTPDIPKDFWDLWLEQNKNSEVVKRGLIFASGKHLEVRAMAKTHRDEKHGLEPIDVSEDSTDPRLGPKRRKGSSLNITTAQAE